MLARVERRSAGSVLGPRPPLVLPSTFFLFFFPGNPICSSLWPKTPCFQFSLIYQRVAPLPFSLAVISATAARFKYVFLAFFSLRKPARFAARRRVLCGFGQGKDVFKAVAFFLVRRSSFRSFGYIFFIFDNSCFAHPPLSLRCFVVGPHGYYYGARPPRSFSSFLNSLFLSTVR